MQRQQAGGRTRAGIFLVGSILLALLASFIVFNMIRKTKQAAEKAAEAADVVEVVVATRDLYMGSPITDLDVEVRKLPIDAVPEEGVFHKLDDLITRTPREHILGNEIIREERLAKPEAGIGLNAIIKPGKRAMTVMTDTEQAIAGLLQPGNYVDIIVAIKPEDPSAAGAKWVSDTILQEVRVLAVGGQLNPPAAKPRSKAEADAKEKGKATEKPAASAANDPNMTRKLKPSITLEVTPEEAEKLALAETQGEVYVTLRSDTDILTVEDRPVVTITGMIGLPTAAPQASAPPKPDRPAAAAAAAPPPEINATVVSGSSSTTYVIDEGGDAKAKDNKRGKNK